MKWFATALVCAAVALASCTQPPAAPADPAAIVAERNAAFMAGVAAGDSAALAANYAEDAVLMPPGNAAVEGREAIGQFWQGGISAGMARIELAEGEVIATSADTILERSTARIFNAAGDVIDQGKYVVVWRKVGDQWLMVWDIWNSDAPPPAAATP
jgi:ketosteroid isomerase-like protein